MGFLLGRAHAAHRAVTGAALRELDLSPKESGALSVLAESGAMSQQQLGERQGVDRTTMVALVDRLEASGMVERRRNAEDRRAYLLHPTAKGRRVLRRADEAERRAEDEFLAPLSARDRRQLKELLRRLL